MRYFEDGGTIESAKPDAIRRQARQLTTVAATMDTVAGMLHKVSTQGSWESPAGDSFAGKVGSTPSDLFTIANRLRGSAEIIRPYADLLAASQKAIADCDTDAHEAHSTMKAKDTELEEMSPDDPDRARVVRERGQAAGQLNRAEGRYETETTEAKADESRMAAKLHEVCERDEDPVVYDYLEWMTNVGETASTAGIVARPVALAGVTKPIGMAGRRALYDEGSYADVAKASAGYGLDTVSFGAGRVVNKAKQRFVDKEVARVSQLDAKPVRIKDNPIIARTPPKGGHPTWRDRARTRAVDTARGKSGMDDVKTAFDDWEMVAGEGRVARVAVAVQLSAKQGRRAHAAARTADRAESTGLTGQAKEQEEAERRKRERAKKVAEPIERRPD